MLKAMIETVAWWMDMNYGGLKGFLIYVAKIIGAGLLFYALLFLGCL